jgi:hypothetical protein
MNCKTCRHYHFYLMITSGSYGYAGDIPCLSCSNMKWTTDKYEPLESLPDAKEADDAG